MVAQKLITQNGRILVVRSRKYKTYDVPVPRDMEIPDDLRKGDTVFVEFKNGTPIVTGFELAERVTDEEYQARLQKQRQEALSLGGDY